MGITPLKLALLVSGGASTARSIIEATKEGGQLAGKVDPVCVVASNNDCEKNLTAAGFPKDKIHIIEKKPKESFGERMLKVLKDSGANFIGQYGWLPETPLEVINKFKGRIINQHPGPLNKGVNDFGGKGMYGSFVHAARLLFAKLTGKNLWTEAVAHRVIKEFDKGNVIQKVRIPIPNHMLDFNPKTLNTKVGALKFLSKVQALKDRVLPYEHQVQKDLLEDAALALNNRKYTLRTMHETVTTDAEAEILSTARDIGPKAVKFAEKLAKAAA